MINDVSRYLSYSRENFSNIVLSVPSDNGISILTSADKRLSRTYPAPRARIQERSRQFPKRGEASRIKNREKFENEVAENGYRTRGELSDWQKTKSKKKRATERSRGGRGGRRKEREDSYTGGSQRNGERRWGFRTRLCFQAGSPRSRLSSALISRWAWLTFNRCVFADVDDDDKEDESESDSPMGTTTSWLYRSVPTIFYCYRLFLRFCLSSPGRALFCFHREVPFFVSGPLSLHCSLHSPNPLLADLIEIKHHVNAAKFMVSTATSLKFANYEELIL